MELRRNPIRVVLFDVGGVLVELAGLEMLLRWLGNRVTPDQVYTMWLTSPTVRAFETGRLAADTFAERLIADFGLAVGKDEFLAAFGSWGETLLPGAVELVDRVPRHYIRATLCNTNPIQWPVLERHRAMIEAFDHHFASHLTGKIKPDEEAFAHVLTTLGCEPREVIFVDDSRLNVAAARKLGIAAFQVDGPAGAERALREAGILPGPR